MRESERAEKSGGGIAMETKRITMLVRFAVRLPAGNRVESSLWYENTKSVSSAYLWLWIHTFRDL